MATDSTHRLHHTTPTWVKNGAVFHIRIRVARENRQPLTKPGIAEALLKSAAYYHEHVSWFCHLLLLMPDHLHALLIFPPSSQMTVAVGRWKAWQKRSLGITWQGNFFDHRIRDKRKHQLKADYIRHNPVVKGLCAQPADWPWVLDSTTLNPG